MPILTETQPEIAKRWHIWQKAPIVGLGVALVMIVTLLIVPGCVPGGVQIGAFWMVSGFADAHNTDTVSWKPGRTTLGRSQGYLFVNLGSWQYQWQGCYTHEEGTKAPR